MAGWFELSNSSDGQFRFVLKAGNAETILTSELYKQKASAQNGIASVQANSGLDERYERKVAKNGKPYFNLKAANHQIIGNSQMYSSDASCENGINSVKTNGSTTTIKDLTCLCRCYYGVLFFILLCNQALSQLKITREVYLLRLLLKMIAVF